jgi:hypothetical protein
MDYAEDATALDWREHLKYPECTCICFACKHVFRSHARGVTPSMMLLTRKPCPACGSHRAARVTSDEETWEL